MTSVGAGDDRADGEHVAVGRQWREPPLYVLAREVRPDVTVLSVEGELDLRTAPVLSRALRANDDRSLVLDLAGVTFCGVAGARALDTVGSVGRDPWRVTVVASDAVRRILEVTGLAPALRHYVWLSDALAAACEGTHS